MKTSLAEENVLEGNLKYVLKKSGCSSTTIVFLIFVCEDLDGRR